MIKVQFQLCFYNVFVLYKCFFQGKTQMLSFKNSQQHLYLKNFINEVNVYLHYCISFYLPFLSPIRSSHASWRFLVATLMSLFIARSAVSSTKAKIVIFCIYGIPFVCTSYGMGPRTVPYGTSTLMIQRLNIHLLVLS